MQFKRPHDPLLRVLFENDEIIAIDKPYGISSHTNDSKLGNEGYIQHGLIELYESQLKRKLHIIHRLDRTTTGVIIFAKSLEAAAKFQAYFRNRETQKTYVFITANQIAATELKSNAPITVKGAELEAETSFTRIARGKHHDLWQAQPKTGRNHQIRIHASTLGIPLLGDTLYGGARYPFICLHNQNIRFPENLEIKSQAPIYFDHLDWIDEDWFTTTLFEIDRRTRAFGKNAQSLKLATNLDLYGDIITASEGNPRSLARVGETVEKQIILHQQDQWVETASESPVTRTEWILEEAGTKYELRLSKNSSPGLSPEHRSLRNWIRENSKNRDVLNIFAANCTASVTATEAKSITSVEPKKSALEWGRRNFELNLKQDAKFFLRDPITFLQQSVAKDSRYDVIICEVPSFLRRDRGIFKVETDLENLLTDCLQSLNDAGDLVFSTTATTLKLGDLRAIIERSARAAKVKKFEIANLLPTLDIALPEETPALKTLIVRKEG